MTRYLRYAYAIFAWLFVAAIVLQVFLAGMFVFGQEQFRETHRGFGFSIVGLSALLLLVSALAAQPGRRQIGWVALIFALYIVQTSLPEARSSYPAIAALHPVNALILFGLAVFVARRATALAQQPLGTEPKPEPEDWFTRQFDTRTIVLMPIAIAINIVLGQAVAAALKIPIYLDSVGTILVGVIAGPIPGLLTGALSNLIWQAVLPPPFHSDFAGPFFVVAAEIGFLAGLFGRWGFFRSRPDTPPAGLAIGGLTAAVIIGAIIWFGVLPFYTNGQVTFFGDTSDVAPFFILVSYLIGIGLLLAAAAFFYLLLVRRDLGVAYVVIAGVITGIVSALISAPISAVVFGGVTGSGTDLLVAAFQQAGSDLQTAVIQQGLLSDPIDKTIEFFVVFLLLQALPRRFVARFPQGEQAIGLQGAN